MSSTSSWKRFFRLGVVHYAAFPEAQGSSWIRSFCHILGDEDYEAVEISTNFDPSLTPAIASLIQSTGLRLILSGGAIFFREGWDLSSFDPEVRQRAVVRVKEIMESADLLGADAVMIFSGPDVQQGRRPQAMDALKTSLKTLSEHGNRCLGTHAPQLHVEIFDRDLTIRRLLGPSGESAQLIRSVRREGATAGITVDLSHIHQQGETPEGVLSELGETLVHVHLSNCVVDDPGDPLYGDKHPPFGWPGSRVGRKELAGFLKALEQSGFFDRPFRGERPIISLEVKPPPGTDPYLILKGAKADFISAWEAFVA
jgi:sugar phosphate isomerase/epimerase